MNIIVFIVGLIISVIGLLLILFPRNSKKLFYKYLVKDWIFLAVIIRLILGVIFIFASNQTRYPIFIYWCGIIILLSAVLLPIVGKERLTKFIKTWLEFPIFVTIIWAIIGFIFGLFIMYTSNIL